MRMGAAPHGCRHAAIGRFRLRRWAFSALVVARECSVDGVGATVRFGIWFRAMDCVVDREWAPWWRSCDMLCFADDAEYAQRDMPRPLFHTREIFDFQIKIRQKGEGQASTPPPNLTPKLVRISSNSRNRARNQSRSINKDRSSTSCAHNEGKMMILILTFLTECKPPASFLGLV